MPTLRSEITQRPQLFSLSGMTAQAASASTEATSGASRNTPLSAPAGISGSLSTNFSRSANDCSRPNGPDHVGAAAQLHGRPHLAVHQQQEGDDDQQGHQQHHALEHHHQQRPEIALPDLRPGPGASHAFRSSPAGMLLLQRAELGHDGGGARDRIGEIEVAHRRPERLGPERAAARRPAPPRPAAPAGSTASRRASAGAALYMAARSAERLS